MADVEDAVVLSENAADGDTVRIGRGFNVVFREEELFERCLPGVEFPEPILLETDEDVLRGGADTENVVRYQAVVLVVHRIFPGRGIIHKKPAARRAVDLTIQFDDAVDVVHGRESRPLGILGRHRREWPQKKHKKDETCSACMDHIVNKPLCGGSDGVRTVHQRPRNS